MDDREMHTRDFEDSCEQAMGASLVAIAQELNLLRRVLEERVRQSEPAAVARTMEAAIERHVAPLVEDKMDAVMTRLVAQASDHLRDLKNAYKVQNAESVQAVLRKSLVDQTHKTIDRYGGGNEP